MCRCLHLSKLYLVFLLQYRSILYYCICMGPRLGNGRAADDGRKQQPTQQPTQQLVLLPRRSRQLTLAVFHFTIFVGFLAVFKFQWDTQWSWIATRRWYYFLTMWNFVLQIFLFGLELLKDLKEIATKEISRVNVLGE